jgi:hypothetical protein
VLDPSKLKLIQMRSYPFLKNMYADSYFPKRLVDQAKAILVALCFEIEERSPNELDELYTLTHAATNKLNDLQAAFDEAESEIETAAAETIALDFEAIAKAYGFPDADIEELVGTRDF